MISFLRGVGKCALDMASKQKSWILAHTIGCTPQGTTARLGKWFCQEVDGGFAHHLPLFKMYSIESEEETYILSSSNAPGYISVQSLQFQPRPIRVMHISTLKLPEEQLVLELSIPAVAC